MEWNFVFDRFTFDDMVEIGHLFSDRAAGGHMSAWAKQQIVYKLKKFATNGHMPFHWHEDEFNEMCTAFKHQFNAWAKEQ